MLGLATILALLTCAQPGGEDAASVEREVAACQQGCANDPGVSETDRASCRLQCTSTRRAYEIRTQGIRQEMSGERPTTAPNLDQARWVTAQPEAPVPGASGYTTVIESAKSPGEIATCQLGCDQAGLATTDRATCKLNCAATTRIVHVVSAPSATPGAPPSGPSTPASVGGEALTACYSSCAGTAGSDASTCRLNCEASHRPRSAATGGTFVHRPAHAGGDPAAAAGCERACDARIELAPTDRATCKLGCSRHTSVVVEQWTSSAPLPPEQCQAACQCGQRCTGHRTQCDASCAGKSGGDAATCRLQCEAVFSSCRNACKQGGCSCAP